MGSGKTASSINSTGETGHPHEEDGKGSMSFISIQTIQSRSDINVKPGTIRVNRKEKFQDIGRGQDFMNKTCSGKKSDQS